MNRPLRAARLYRFRLHSRRALGYLLAGCAIGLGAMIWVSNNWLEPLCVWAASYDPNPRD